LLDRYPGDRFNLDPIHPLQINFRAPVANGSSSFSFDLRAAARESNETLAPGKYQVYLASGKTVLGPEPMELR
jgi:hypothetical protein